MASESGSSEGLPEGSMDLEDMLAAIRDAKFPRRNVPFDDESLENTEELLVSWIEFESLFGSTYSEVLNQYVRFLVQAISIRPCPNLQKLVLDCSDESKETFVNFLESVSWGHLPNLKSVKIRGGTGAEVAEYIAKAAEEGHLPKLSSLELMYADVADGVVALMRAAKSGHLHNLEHLNLWGEYLTEERSAALGQAIEAGSLERLQSLFLWVENYGGALVLARALTSGKVQSLSTLQIMLKGGQAGLTALDGLTVLASALEAGSVPSLKALIVVNRGGMIPEEGSEAMARAMLSGHLSQLEMLHLDGLEAGEMVVHALARGEFASLKSLWLLNCSLGEEAATVVAAQLELGRWPSFEHLNLYWNPLGDGGVAALARGLEGGHLDKLMSLDLRRTDMHDEGAMAIGAVFANETLQFQNLEKVNIRENEIGETGAAALVNAYRKNALLTAKLALDWPEGSPWEGNYEGFRKRNLRGLEAAKILREDKEKVPAALGRVFLCGEPEVGKTTLRRSLESSCSEPEFGKTTLRRSLESSCSSFCRRFLASVQSLSCFSSARQAAPENERTRGIEVSCISNRGSNPLTLSVWDLAGQREYHILHAAFFPEAAFMEVQATLFVVLCRDTGASPTNVESKNLEYWFRFIASSSLRGIDDSKRRVLVLRNRHGDSTSGNAAALDDEWNEWVDPLKTQFKDFMTIELYSTSFDVRSRREVKHFCQKLFSEAGELLSQKEIPQICGTLQSDLQSWGKLHDQFPILTAQGVREIVKKWKSVSSSEEHRMVVANAALKYLNQVGTLIFFPEGSLSDGGMGESSLAVADPGWFCRRVVGDLLLPDSLLQKGKEELVRRTLRMDAAHAWTIRVDDLRRLYENKCMKLEEEEMQQIVAILLHVGLCFKVDPERIFVPALAPQAIHLPSWWSECEENPKSSETHWVMGLSLVHLDAEKTLMPASLFYKFQVLLTQDPAIQSRIGKDFHAGPNFVALRAMHMKILVEFRTSETSADTDRVDFMVKPALTECKIPLEEMRHRQINFADDLAKKLEEARISCCPGVRLETRAIKPWSVRDHHPKMEDRNVDVPLQKILDGLVKVDIESGIGLEWENQIGIEWDVKGEEVKREDLLRAEDLSIWAGRLSRKRNAEYARVQGMKELLSTLSRSEEVTGMLDRTRSVAARTTKPEAGPADAGTDRRIDLLEDRLKILEYQVSRLQRELGELRSELRILSSEQQDTWLRLSSLEACSSAEQDSSIPRFVYCLPKDKEESGRSRRKWVREFTEVFKSSCTLHFLCESGLHEVDEQEGHDVTHMAEWLQTHVAWLKWSIYIASVGASIGVAAIPGLNVLAPPAIAGAFQVAQTGVSEMEAHIKALRELKLASSSAQNPIAVKGPSKKALQDLFGRVDLTPALIKQKFKLTRTFHQKDHKGPRAQVRMESQVLWVCENCVRKDGLKEI